MDFKEKITATTNQKQDLPSSLSESRIVTILEEGLGKLDLAGKRILLIIPDRTRTAPVGPMVKRIYRLLKGHGCRLDVLVALGTHPALNHEDYLCHLDMAPEIYARDFGDMDLFNHEWDNPRQLIEIGTLPRPVVEEVSGGLLSQEVPITVNRLILEYDHLLILGPVFPHEVAGFSGGHKYFFPGISGPEIMHFFHWLAALVTNLKIIGIADNPVRRTLAKAAEFMPRPASAISLVVHHDKELAGLFVGPVTTSWRSAVELSSKLHIIYKNRTFHRALVCAPQMYEDMWTGGKCMYKYEHVMAEGGELIIYAPHMDSLSHVHSRFLEETGYHVRDYFLSHPERFAHIPRTVLAVAALIRGSGTYENGRETPRIKVTLATRIPETLCRKVGLGYLDPASVNFAEWQNREVDGILYVERGGELLYLLKQ